MGYTKQVTIETDKVLTFNHLKGNFWGVKKVYNSNIKKNNKTDKDIFRW